MKKLLNTAPGLLFDNKAVGVGLGVNIGEAIDTDVGNKNKEE